MFLKRLNDKKAVIPAPAGIQTVDCHPERHACRHLPAGRHGAGSEESLYYTLKRDSSGYLPAGRQAPLRMTIGMLLFLFIPIPVFAAASEKIPLPNPLGTTNILDLGARLIQAGLGIAGSLALLFFIYGGFLWLTSAGVPDKIKKGRDVFLWSTVGLVIIFSSYLMVDFVIKALTQAGQKEADTALSSCSDKAKKEAEQCLTKCYLPKASIEEVISACKEQCDSQATATSEMKQACKVQCDESQKNNLADLTEAEKPCGEGCISSAEKAKQNCKPK